MFNFELLFFFTDFHRKIVKFWSQKKPLAKIIFFYKFANLRRHATQVECKRAQPKESVQPGSSVALMGKRIVLK